MTIPCPLRAPSNHGIRYLPLPLAGEGRGEGETLVSPLTLTPPLSGERRSSGSCSRQSNYVIMATQTWSEERNLLSWIAIKRDSASPFPRIPLSNIKAESHPPTIPRKPSVRIKNIGMLTTRLPSFVLGRPICYICCGFDA